MEQINPFVTEQYIEVLVKNRKSTKVDIESIPTSDEIITNPEIVKLEESFIVERDSKVSIYKNSTMLEVKMKMSEVALKLLSYITETLSWNQDYIKFNGLKMNNFMASSEIKSKTTVYKGITELCRYGFLAADIKRGYYWVNPFRVFYGNRLKKYPDKIKSI